MISLIVTPNVGHIRMGAPMSELYRVDPSTVQADPNDPEYLARGWHAEIWSVDGESFLVWASGKVWGALPIWRETVLRLLQPLTGHPLAKV